MIELSDLVALADRLLNLEPSQASLSETKLGMVGPDEALDSHGAAEWANADEAKLDIVLLSADLLAMIKQTHSSYFNGGDSQLKELLPS